MRTAVLNRTYQTAPNKPDSSARQEVSLDVTYNVPQASGHTICGRHIEKPCKRFIAESDSAGYTNILRFTDTHRWLNVLAETPEGALAIARYHHGLRGSNFALVDTG